MAKYGATNSVTMFNSLPDCFIETATNNAAVSKYQIVNPRPLLNQRTTPRSARVIISYRITRCKKLLYLSSTTLKHELIS